VARTYWLDLFTGTTWKEFLAAGGEVSGFRERRWKTVQQMEPGDYLLCYLTGISRWIGVLEVVSEPFKDTTPIWKDEAFPARVRVRQVATLAPETAVPVFELRDELSVFRDLKNPNAWTGHFRGSPARWKPADGQAVVAAILEAKRTLESLEVV
jgi:predicted RNA-binding protein